MKENCFGPRQWAFVVITGGAACALPFLQTDNAPTRTDSASTSFPPDAPLDPRSPLGNVGSGGSLAGSSLVAPSSLGDVVPPLPAPRLPEWASADRSPFDDLVGLTATKPEATPPREQLPMQPLRPWIAGPNDSPVLPAAQSPQRTTAAAAVADRTLAQRSSNALEASPWSDEPTRSTSVDGLASVASQAPSDYSASVVAAADRAAGAGPANVDQAQGWPDQTVSAEEIAQVTRSRDRELASAVVSPRPPQANSSSALLAAPALPVAAQRFGQAYLPPDSATLRASTLSGPAPERPASAGSFSGTPAGNSNLPPLPATRKSHIIFQPGSRK